MTKDNYIERLLKIVGEHHFQWRKFIDKPKNFDLLEFINSYESDKLKNNDLKTKIYWILNDIHDYPNCHNPNCSNQVRSNVRNIFIGYGTQYPTCCSSCAKKTPEYLKKYGDSIEKHFGEGCRHPMHSKEVKDKVANTTIENWGGIGFASKELNAKERQIFKEKYGSEDPGNLPEFREKAKQTFIENWGVDNPMQCQEVKDKVVETNLQKYGAEYYLMTKECQERRIQTCIDKYGGRCPLCDKNILQKSVETKLERYGKPFYGSSFGMQVSKAEKEVLEYVKSIYSGTIIENDRTQMEPNVENGWKDFHELDIWLPDLRVAIEFNGKYWHSLPVVIESDKFKQIQCESKGIRLLSISESDWDYNKDYCLQRIAQFLIQQW